MRNAFSNCLVDLVKKNPNTYLLSGDHGYALFDLLRKERPDHFINAGVAEQNMIGVGAGLSKLGFYPVIYGLSAFVPIRVLEQIKIDFCYENLPGLFIGDGAGVVYSHLGTSHQSTEDISALKAVPSISILSPCDAHEFNACFNWATQQKSPVYIRMGKDELGSVHKNPLSNFDAKPIGVFTNMNKVAIYATGSMVRSCLDLVEQGKIKADVYSVPVLKGLQKINLFESLKMYSKVVTVEEHSIYGGLGDLIAADAAELGTVKVKKIGIEDQFSKFCGTYKYLIQEHGLDIESLEKKIKDWI
jgi:transketolase